MNRKDEVGLDIRFSGVHRNLIPNCIGFCHGQILIETATYSLEEAVVVEQHGIFLNRKGLAIIIMM